LKGLVATKELVIALALLGLAACGGDSGTSGTPTGGSLVVEDITVGTGATAVSGDTVTVHYIGALTNGAVFDTSYGRSPYTFRLGANQVIAGFDQGIVGMKVGGKRRLTIPPSLGYGSQGNGPIPPNSTLVFEVELVSIAGK
jgi:FKBP-type peptidyl-prolyl cis-trans isomerase FkpA